MPFTEENKYEGIFDESSEEETKEDGNEWYKPAEGDYIFGSEDHVKNGNVPTHQPYQSDTAIPKPTFDIFGDDESTGIPSTT